MSTDSSDKKKASVNGKLGLSTQLLDILVCPRDHGTLEIREGDLVCTTCGNAFAVADGIPSLVTDPK